MKRLLMLILNILILTGGLVINQWLERLDQKTLAEPPLTQSRGEMVVEAIDDWNSGLSTADREAKYCKMITTPFIFYRGTNHLFWADFYDDARLTEFQSDKTTIWIQGDLHTDNFGSYHNDEAEIIYDLNDFDESLLADYQFDVWRLAISLVLVAEQNGSLTVAEQEAMLDAFSESYLDTLADYRGNNNELDTYFTEANTYGKLDNFLEEVEADDSRLKMLNKWTNVVNGQRVFDLSLADLEALSGAEQTAITNAMAAYGNTLSGGLNYTASHFQVKDVARRLLAGTGSLGTPRYYILIEGETASQDDDRILDVKHQGNPTAYTFMDATEQAVYDNIFSNPAERHAIAYLALTKHTDDYLGWLTLSDGPYSVRERSPYKETFPTADLETETQSIKLAEQWGTILATNHARADKDYDETWISYSFDKQVDLVTAGHHAEFRALVRQIAFEYANQVNADWAYFVTTYPNLTCP